MLALTIGSLLISHRLRFSRATQGMRNNMTVYFETFLTCSIFIKKKIKKKANRQSTNFNLYMGAKRQLSCYRPLVLLYKSPFYRGTQRQFSENICSEDDLSSRIFRTFVVKLLACLPLLGFSNIYKMV